MRVQEHLNHDKISECVAVDKHRVGYERSMSIF